MFSRFGGVWFFALLGYASRGPVAKRLPRVFRSCHASLDPKNGARTTHASRARIHVRARPRLARAMPHVRSLRPRSLAQPRGADGARPRARDTSRSGSFARARSQPFSLRQPRAGGLAVARSIALGSLAGLSSRAGALLILGLAHPVRAPTFWGLARVSARGFRAPSPRAGTVAGSSPPCAFRASQTLTFCKHFSIWKDNTRVCNTGAYFPKSCKTPPKICCTA